MKKNFSVILICLTLLNLLSACTSNQSSISSNKPLNEYLVSNSIELTCIMDSLAQSDEYIKLISIQPDLIELVSEIGNDDYMYPNKAVVIKVPDTTINSLIKDMFGELNLPDNAHKMVITRICSSIPSQINAQQGVNVLAATSILTASKAFQHHKEFSGNIYVILCYDNYSSATIFNNSLEVGISASSTFVLFTDDMKNIIEEETAANYLLEIFNAKDIEIEYITKDKIANYK